MALCRRFMESAILSVSSSFALNNELTYFFQQVEQHSLMRKVFGSDYLDDGDFAGFCFEKTGQNEFCIMGLSLSASDFFHTVLILKTRFGSVIEFETFNTSYFDNSVRYFDVDGPGRISGFYTHKKERYPIRIKRVKRVNIHGRQVDCSIQKCPLYGCKIILSFNHLI